MDSTSALWHRWLRQAGKVQNFPARQRKKTISCFEIWPCCKKENRCCDMLRDSIRECWQRYVEKVRADARSAAHSQKRVSQVVTLIDHLNEARENSEYFHSLNKKNFAECHRITGQAIKHSLKDERFFTNMKRDVDGAMYPSRKRNDGLSEPVPRFSGWTTHRGLTVVRWIAWSME